jgi:hypothetical protein
MTTPAPPPFWKVLSFILPLTLFGVAPVLLFMRYPNYMSMCTSLFSLFIVFFLLGFIIPDNPSLSYQRNPATKQALVSKLAPSPNNFFLWLLLAEFFIFLLSKNFSIFAFNLSEQEYHHSTAPPHWSVWLGLWAYFSTIIAMQHYAHHQLRQANFASGLFFLFKNTYIDIAMRRALGLFNLGLNLVGIYLLIISVIFIVIEYFRPEALQNFHAPSILFWGLFSYFNLRIQEKKIKQFFNRTSLPNVFYIFIASLCCAAAIWISATLSQFFFLANVFSNIHFVSEKHPLSPLDPSLFLFIGMFVLVTPLFASLIVKRAANIGRKKLLLITFLFPNIFYFILANKHTGDLLNALNNKGLFVAIAIIFLVMFFQRKTTADFMTGMLPLPKQRAIIPTNSYLLFPAHCLVIFNFYLLAIIIGPISLYAITITACLLSAILGTIGICSYFGKTYRIASFMKH